MLDDPNALERDAGMTDHPAVERARRAVEQLAEAERALRQALVDRNTAVRDPAAANLGVGSGALSRAVGLRADALRVILRADSPSAAWG